MKRIEVYLDTNMIHDFFVNQTRYLKEKGELRIPRKFEFMEANKKKIDFVTSFLTKAEIDRELVSAHSMLYNDVSLVWNKFVESLGCEYIPRAEFDESMVEIVAKIRMKLRTMVNFLHLSIATRKDVYFVSVLMLLAIPSLATHNPSVSHSATNIVNGTFSDNYTFISYAQNATPISNRQVSL